MQYEDKCPGCGVPANIECKPSCSRVAALKEHVALEKTLRDRAEKYGDFTDLGVTAQNLKETAREAVGWRKLSRHQKESVEMILHKIARIISGGDPNYADNWHDIAGYAKLVEDRIDPRFTMTVTPGLKD